MNRVPGCKLLAAGVLVCAAALCLPCSFGASERPYQTVAFLGRSGRDEAPHPLTTRRVLRADVVRLARGQGVDVTRWRPTGDGADVVVTCTLGRGRVDLQVTWKRGSSAPERATFRGPSSAAAWLARRLTRGPVPVPAAGWTPAALEAMEAALAVGEADREAARVRKRALLAKVVRRAPDWALAHLELGTAACAQGDTAAALRHLSRAAALAPKDPGVWAELGRAYRGAGRPADAISSYSRALRLAPADPVIHNNFGVALLHAGQAAGAVRHFKRAAEIEALYSEPHVNLGSYCRSIGERARAEAHYRRAVTAAPRAAGPRIALANLLVDAGDHRAAQTELESAVAANPRHPPAIFDLALVLATRQSYTAAIERLEQVLELAPEYETARYNLGLCHHYAGRPGRAIEVFEEGIRRRPDYAPLYYGLGLAHEAKQEKRLAEAALEMALEKAPRFEPARQALKRVRGERPPSQLAWPWGMWCGPARGESSASCVPTAVVLAALFLPALLMRRRRSGR